MTFYDYFMTFSWILCLKGELPSQITPYFYSLFTKYSSFLNEPKKPHQKILIFEITNYELRNYEHLKMAFFGRLKKRLLIRKKTFHDL